MINFFNNLNVFYHDRLVGTLSLAEGNCIAFEYDSEWIENGFSISPFSLPLEKRVFIPKYDEPFFGLFGVFYDSFPLAKFVFADRVLLKNNLDPTGIDNLNRLVVVGESGMGALTYKPENEFEFASIGYDYNKIVHDFSEIFETQGCDDLGKLYKLKSAKTSRTIVFKKIDNEEWIIKFPLLYELKHGAENEYKYSLCAKECGINMPETGFFRSDTGPGFFGIKRFDRKNGKKIHTISATALLELGTANQLNWNFDYNDLMKFTLELTHDFKDIEQLYKLMCFNVFAHNFDDYGKNFSFIYDEDKKEWHLAPAYDLTFSYSLRMRHCIKVNGEDRNPTLDDILAVAKNIGIEEKQAKDIALDIKEKCLPLLDLPRY